MDSSVWQRVIDVLRYSGLSKSAFAKKINMEQTTVNNQLIGKRSVSIDLVSNILKNFDQISSDWLLTGKGFMLKSEEDMPIIKVNTIGDGIPYYADLPVSAGQLDTFIQDAEPTGWVKLPGVTSKALFPVIGCSMKPEINPGDVVGIIQIDSWEVVDPDKIYLIIMHDERMIKHLAVDEEDDSILWCISPNYPKFKINKDDIKCIYRISFCGKLM